MPGSDQEPAGGPRPLSDPRGIIDPLGLGDPAPVTVGSQVAGYRLLEQIGRGGMAVVYRAIDVRLDRAVALKVLAPELARDEAFRLRFIRECRAAAAVDHPYIIPVFDAGEASGILFIAMRYVSGRDVRSLLDQEQTLPAWRTVSIIEQVGSALDAAHGRGLVHRDVKPANMLLDTTSGSGQQDHVYLSDFGLTKQALSTSSLTSTGQFLGTLDYIAPEQIENKNVDGRADQYSLACAAYEMLAGSPPFRRDQGVAVIWAQVSAPVPQLTDRRPDLPVAVDTVLTKALAKKPEQRYRSCQEFASALRRACGLTSGSDVRRGSGLVGPPTELAGRVVDPGATGLPGRAAGGSWPARPGGQAAGEPAAAGRPGGAGGADFGGAAGRGGAAGLGGAAGAGGAGLGGAGLGGAADLGAAAGLGAAGLAAAGGPDAPARFGPGGGPDAAARFGSADRSGYAPGGAPGDSGDSADYGGGFRSARGYGQPGSSASAPEPPTAQAPIRPTKAERPPYSAFGASGYSPPAPPDQRSAASRAPGQYPPGQYPPGQQPSGQFPPGQRPPGHYPPGPGQRLPGTRPGGRRSKWRSPAAIIVGLLIVVVLAGGAAAALRHRHHPGSSATGSSSTGASTSASSATSTGTATAPVRGPARTVLAYFAALNARNYLRAWNLGGRNTNSTYPAYVNGYDDTSRTTVKILSLSGSVVTARVTAVQTDGTVKFFQGTYTVTSGVITYFNVHQTS